MRASTASNVSATEKPKVVLAFLSTINTRCRLATRTR